MSTGCCVRERADLDDRADARGRDRRREDCTSRARTDDAGRHRGPGAAEDDAAGSYAALSHPVGFSIAFFDASGVRWVRAYGATPATLFQAGSISKPVSAVGIMRLVQDGRLNLDANVNGELTGWKLPENALTAKRPVTLRNLLSHTAGTTVHGFEGYYAREAGSDAGASPGRHRAGELARRSRRPCRPERTIVTPVAGT